MKRLILALAIGAAAALASCEDPRPAQVETAETPSDALVAPAAEDQAAPAAETAAPPPVDSETLPPEERASEETVKPESETLFY